MLDASGRDCGMFRLDALWDAEGVDLLVRAAKIL